MRNLLYAAVHTTEYGTEVHLFNHPATGENPRPTDNPEKLAALLGINFIPDVDTLIAAPVKNSLAKLLGLSPDNPDFKKED